MVVAVELVDEPINFEAGRSLELFISNAISFPTAEYARSDPIQTSVLTCVNQIGRQQRVVTLDILSALLAKLLWSIILGMNGSCCS
jgi:hypothetical protein